ncbi:unnamed protein product [Cunninghamella echinulata]
MPPKKNQTKTDKKKSAKAIEDKTFGMKNKNKSSKVQKYIQTVQQQAKNNRESAAKVQAKKSIADKKAEEEKRKQELQELFKPVQIVQKVPFGTNPKLYSNGNCDKGTKCKFSHDLNVNRKVEKKDLYTDSREEDKENAIYIQP